jgi:transposase
MAYLGLVPSENSTGDKHRRGPITKAGNTHAHIPGLARLEGDVSRRRTVMPALLELALG